MDLRQLQAFLAVIEHGGFTAAARATHTVQSNVSTHVARLERELDAVLIDRSTGEPTQEGEAVLARARRIQSELAALEADVSSLQGSPRGTARLGIIGTTARWLTPLLVEAMAVAAPEVRLIVIDGTTSSQAIRLLDGDLDLGVVGLPVDDPEIRTSPLFDEDQILVVPDGHPLADHPEPVPLSELAKHELLMAASGTAFRAAIDAAFAERDLKPRIKVEIDGLRLLASLAFRGYGVAIVPATAAPGWIGGEWTRLAIDELPRRRVGIAVRRRGMLSVAAQTTASCIQRTIASEAPTMVGLHVPAAAA